MRAGRRDRILTAPAKVELVRGGDNPWFEVTLTEGRNRQLRKMFEEIGHHVEKIRRIGYGALRLDVAPGEFRELKPGEVTALDRAAKGRKVEPKKNLPEFAKLKAPVKPKAAQPRRDVSQQSRAVNSGLDDPLLNAAKCSRLFVGPGTFSLSEHPTGSSEVLRCRLKKLRLVQGASGVWKHDSVK